MFDISLTKDEATELYHYLRFQYISHEKFPRVHGILGKICNAIQSDEATENRVEDSNSPSQDSER